MESLLAELPSLHLFSVMDKTSLKQYSYILH